MLKVLTVLLLLFFCSCKNKSSPKPVFEDSVVRQYLSFADSIGSYEDTNSYSRRILNAILDKDTLRFRLIQNELDEYKKYIYPDWFAHTPKLSDLAVDEAYRLILSRSFCNYAQTITISKKGNAIGLQYLEYPLSVSKDSIIKIEKMLKDEEWRELIRALHRADFWGLKYRSSNPRVVLDGYSLRIESYIRKPEYFSGQIHSISRHSPELKELEDLSRLFYKLSGQQTMCH